MSGFESLRASHAVVAQLVERHPSKLDVAGSSPVCRTNLLININVLKFNAFFNINESIDNLFNWFGGDSSSHTGGLYPGVQGKDACKNMILDSWAEDPQDKIFIANAIDALKDRQLIELMCLNYDGTPLSDMPPFIKEFSAGQPEDKYFVAPDTTSTRNVLDNAINYFKSDPSKLILPEWASKRDDAMELRDIIVSFKRKEESSD